LTKGKCWGLKRKLRKGETNYASVKEGRKVMKKAIDGSKRGIWNAFVQESKGDMV
jgi:hypothetical protein